MVSNFDCCFGFSLILHVFQENATVDNIIKFLIQRRKICTGYNVIYTVLDRVRDNKMFFLPKYLTGF